jgi:dienelactone hydrolase
MKMKSVRSHFVLVVLCLLTLASAAMAVTAPDANGPYTTCTYTPPSNSGYSAAKVYYPCEISAKAGATTLTGGFTNQYSDMAWIANHLSKWGYIVYAMTPNNIYGNNPSWTSAHKAGIAMLKSENGRTASKIYGKVDTTKLQIMGFSKGGGGALLASASLGSGVKTTQAMAPYMDSSYNLSGIKSNTICYTGTSDSIASPGNVVKMYNSLPSSIDRTLAYFNGFPHTDWMPGSTNNTNTNKAKKYITAFMLYWLDGNASYQTYLYGAEHTKDMNNNWFYKYAHNG